MSGQRIVVWSEVDAAAFPHYFRDGRPCIGVDRVPEQRWTSRQLNLDSDQALDRYEALKERQRHGDLIRDVALAEAMPLVPGGAAAGVTTTEQATELAGFDLPSCIYVQCPRCRVPIVSPFPDAWILDLYKVGAPHGPSTAYCMPHRPGCTLPEPNMTPDTGIGVRVPGHRVAHLGPAHHEGGRR